MKKLILLSILALFSIASVNAQFDKLLKKGKDLIEGKSDDNTGNGLKEALQLGVDEAVTSLSAKNGYLESPYKILIPEDAQKVINKVKKVPGFQNVETKLISQMNAAAELAAKKATPIFVNAITALTFKDAMNILMGEQDAATLYLKSKSEKKLYDAFMPIIQNSLEEVNALSYWKTVVTAYNGIPFVKKMNPELDDHVNQKALNGLFGLIEVKEAGIRTDVSQRTSPLLKEIFAKQDK